MIAEELVTLLGVELSPGAKEKLQAFDKGLDAVVSRVKQASVVLTAAAGGMALYFSNAVNGAADLQRLSDTTGVSTTKLQEWAYAANAMGVSASAVQSDLAKMEKQARWTGRTLESYANQFKGMDAATANIWGDAYGLSPETVLLLRQGADGIAKLKAEAHDVGAIIPPETVKRASEFKAQVVQITTMIRGMATTIALAALPQAERLVSTFKGWVTENREWIRLGIGKIIEGMGTAFERVWKAGKRLLDWVKDALGPVGDFFSELGKGADWSKLLTGALTLLLAAFAPLIAKIALIAAGFALASAVVEDFFGFLEGKDSVIGRIIGAVKDWFDDLGEKFPALRAMIEDIAKFVGGILKRNLDSVKEVIELISKIFDGFWGKVQSGIEKVAELGNDLARLLGYKDEAQEEKDKKLREGEKEISAGLEQRTNSSEAPVGQAGLQAVRDSLSPDRSKRTKETQTSPVALGTFAEQVAAYGQQRPGGVKVSPGGQMSMRVQPKNGPTVTDNREYNVYQTITPSDPRQAAEQAARSFSEIAQINTPGLNAAVVY
ncbi:hypothetical protein [Bilophila wadsworthia]|jgi:hypothetical protein|uniref:hypothetical protein n=1 Tax=Bilophila wadsworthia TaxID=35833 RepID=UPI0024203EF7|nr:hypothetical protein [Bilophila wadsworthia]